MFWRIVVLLAAVALVPSGARASCGSEHCPIDLGMPWERSVLTFDLSQQYIDQDQPRVGTRDAAVGALPSHEDEVRTVNRITTARAVYQPNEKWTITGSLPFVNRYHEHFHNEPGNPPELMRWSYRGVGDLEAQVSRSFAHGEEKTTRYHVEAGFKAPTGVRHVEEFNGEEPEPPARPSTGAWGAIAGVGARWSLTTKMPGGDYYPVSRSLELLLSGDFRVRAKDDPGNTDADPGHTGGTWVFASPGIRVNAKGKTAFYGVVQLPVYQRVNGINLVSDFNLYLGVSRAAL
ncbi:MAG: hypothetical protein E6K74_00905 [Candidatus Eisenbacteria bacterium]|uniref:Transporter n=1 Tax=Eiseniibacteriota bacterium TaxID=2212470 RepID=A0A538SXP4_UNCEI|nr:MAG: hypothetical protein E6K74_00905 [Candidatus Eisenbacteria bacterium]